MIDIKPYPHVPHYPTNGAVSRFISLMDGQSQRVFFTMRETVERNTGTPQENQDWTHPDDWIPLLLDGNERDLALHIWRVSEGQINPRHLNGVWLHASNYHLFEADMREILHLTPAGTDFIQSPLGKTVQQIDYSEGLLNLLLIISGHGPGKRSQFMPAFIE